jgi:HEAT repeats
LFPLFVGLVGTQKEMFNTMICVSKQSQLVFLCTLIVVFDCGQAQGQDGYYFSVGDNHTIANNMSLQSPEVIGATFDMLQNVYGVERIYWRGLQMTQISDSIVRPEDANFALRFEWQNTTLDQQMQINQTAVQLAHDRGMELWGEGALYDWGANGTDSVGSFLAWPGPVESNFRVNNPQWEPVDRYGMRRQSGPIELAYPAARTALSNWFTQTATDTGYDGVMFTTFAENYSTNYANEFGFNDPIVAEFQSRYGVDIRRESFNTADWQNLRGEYTTQFLATLQSQLSAGGIKLGVELNGTNPNQGLPWGGLPFATAGSMNLDWQKWVDDGLVDELQFRRNFSNGDDVSTVINYTNGTPVQITSVHQQPYNSGLISFKNQGVSIIGAALTLEEFMRNGPLPALGIGSINDPDPYNRMRVLGRIIDGDESATVAQVSPLLNDENVLVRRMAIKALGAIGDPSAIPLLENAMFDLDNAINSAAVRALRFVNDASTPQLVLDAMAQIGNPTFLEEAKNTLVSFGPAAMELPLTNAVRLQDPSVDVRRLAMRTLWNLSGPHTNRMRSTITVGMSDPDPYVRYWAAAHAANIAPDNSSLDALIAAAQGSDTVVSTRAADSIGKVITTGFSAALARKGELIGVLADQFAQFGDGTIGSDTDWAYQVPGRALQDVGPDGLVYLRDFMTQRSDRTLSENAWRILHIPSGRAPSVVTELQAQDAFLRRPRWDPVLAMADSFDNGTPGQLLTSYTPDTGTQWQVLFGDPNDQTIVSRNGEQVLELRRGFNSGTHGVKLTGHLYDAAVAEITRVTVKADWLREDAGTFGRLVLDLGHTGAVRNPSIIANTDGNYWVLTADTSINTGVPIGVGGWETIELALTWGIADGDLVEGTYDVYLSRDSNNSLGVLDRLLIASDISVAATNLTTMQQLILLNDANLTGDAVTYWDNISVVVDPILDFLLGDLDGDGFVGIADLNIVLGNWNQNIPPGDPLADPSGDGFVGIADLNIVLGNWNAGSVPPSSVPEPGMIEIVFALLFLLALKRRGNNCIS